jgi:hypothetical protein
LVYVKISLRLYYSAYHTSTHRKYVFWETVTLFSHFCLCHMMFFSPWAIFLANDNHFKEDKDEVKLCGKRIKTKMI